MLLVLKEVTSLHFCYQFCIRDLINKEIFVDCTQVIIVILSFTGDVTLLHCLCISDAFMFSIDII